MASDHGERKVVDLMAELEKSLADAKAERLGETSAERRNKVSIGPETQKLVQSLVVALRAIRDEDFDGLGLTKHDAEAIRLGQGEADYRVIDAMKVTARRALENIGDFG